MAFFYDKLKGIGKTSISNSYRYTDFIFSEQNPQSTDNHFLLPTVKSYIKKEDSSREETADLGYLLSSEATGQCINNTLGVKEELWTKRFSLSSTQTSDNGSSQRHYEPYWMESFDSGTVLDIRTDKKTSSTEWNEYQYHMVDGYNGNVNRLTRVNTALRWEFDFYSPSNEKPEGWETGKDKILKLWIDRNTSALSSYCMYLELNGQLRTKKLIAEDNFTIGTDGNKRITFNTNNEGEITATGPVNAVYFNATSDKRAKTNIQEYTSSALDIIKKVRIYTYNYKNTNIPSIGVMAQDVKDIKFDNNFNLVDNLEASGKDNDFMLVKESKLTYILWKAVQEQQKEIEILQQQIKTLTEKLS